MKTTFISTYSIGEAVRNNIMRSQQRLADAQLELSTGKHADVGVAVGGMYSNLTFLKQQREELVTLTQSNAGVSTKLGVTQDALESIVNGAQEFVAELIGAEGTSAPDVIQKQGASRLSSFQDLINVNFDGSYLFSGTNAGQAPVEDYFETPAPASRTAVETAFITEFGFPPSDPAVSTISAAAMTTFLDGAFSDLFDDPAWGTNWSSANDTLAEVRISSTETIEASVSANEQGFRKIASVYAAASDLGTAQLNERTFEVFAFWMAERTGQAVSEVSVIQAQVGTMEQRIGDAVDRAQIQRNVLDLRIGDIEEVDPFEATARVTSLLTQIETSYAVTARIQQLSILNFL
jgi:flagellar hook-associated protein 3 FlgL